MRILILGGDGYLGWPTALRFSARGHEVSLVDNFSRRRWHTEHGTASLTPIGELEERIGAWREVSGEQIRSYVGAVEDGDFLEEVVAETRPEAIVHYGQQASAPFSMLSRERAVETQHANVIGNLNLLFAMRDHVPDAHLVKLGTMGEYGQPEIDIEEGYIEIEHKGRKDTLPYPKLPGSLYHCSKVHDSTNIHFACRTWGLRATDLTHHPFCLPPLGPARHRPQPGRRLRSRDRGDRPRRPPRHPLRLRRALRHRPQPLLRPGGDRPPADRLRRRPSDPRLPQHPRHPRLRRTGGPQPGRAWRVPRLQPVHRAVLGPGAGRAGQGRRRAPRLQRRGSALREPAGR